jgi:hypothetical protein
MTGEKIDAWKILKTGLFTIAIIFYCLFVAIIIGGYTFGKRFIEEFRKAWGELKK